MKKAQHAKGKKIFLIDAEDSYDARFYDSSKYHLSTEGFYFQYRTDNNDRSILRATLYKLNGERVDDVRVSAGYGLPEKSHHDVINYFEARLLTSGKN